MTDKTKTSTLGTSELGWLWRPKWFLLTRFMAVLGVAGTLAVAFAIFHIDTIHYRALVVLAAVLLTSNVAYVLYYVSGRLSPDVPAVVLEKRIVIFTTMQINTDLVILTFMLHYSGGATNPFILYYFFHTILSSILLSRRAANIEATVAVVLFGSMTLFEGYGVIRHYDLFCPEYYTKPIFMSGMVFAVTTALYIAVYMASSIMDRLRLHQVELEKALEEQRRLEEEKSRFLDVVAHDLKSPLAAIETMATSALAVYKDSMTPEVKKILERIPLRTKDLIRFIQDLLEFSRIRKIEDAQANFKALNILPIVTATIEMYMGQAMDKNINMTVQSEPNIPPIMGSKEHLERMTANLVSNAIRYTRENGSVTVKLGIDKGWIVLTVADTGIGIPEKALPYIFTDFFRADNAKKFSSAGTGLGMSIVKAVVDQHGGTVSVTSEEGEGTVFTVRLPVLITNPQES